MSAEALPPGPRRTRALAAAEDAMDDATDQILASTGPDAACSSAGMRWRQKFQAMTGHKREVLEARELFACELAFRDALRQELPAQTRARLIRGLSLTRFGQRRLDVIITKNVSFSQAIDVEKTAPTVGLYLAGEAWEDAPTATDAERRAARVHLRATALDNIIAANNAKPSPRKDPNGRNGRNPNGRGRGRNGRRPRGGRGKRKTKKQREAAAAARALNPPAKTAAQKQRSDAVAKAIKAGGCTHCKALVPRPSSYLFHLEADCWKKHPEKRVKGKKRQHT